MASHLNIYIHPPSNRTIKFHCPKCPTVIPRRAFSNQVLKVSAEKRDNLDRLQRMTPQPTQTNRVPQVAPPGLWDRFPTARTVQQMMDTMERVMDDPFAYSTTWPPATSSGRDGYSRGRTPWAIKEGEKDYKMRFDMPGMNKDNVKVWVEEKMLVVKAEKAPEVTDESQVSKAKEDDGYEEWSAKSYGRYSCRIALPENIEFEKIKAEVKDGVLYITIPKASTTGRVIGINVQ